MHHMEWMNTWQCVSIYAVSHAPYISYSRSFQKNQFPPSNQLTDGLPRRSCIIVNSQSYMGMQQHQPHRQQVECASCSIFKRNLHLYKWKIGTRNSRRWNYQRNFDCCAMLHPHRIRCYWRVSNNNKIHIKMFVIWKCMIFDIVLYVYEQSMPHVNIRSAAKSFRFVNCFGNSSEPLKWWKSELWLLSACRRGLFLFTFICDRHMQKAEWIKLFSCSLNDCYLWWPLSLYLHLRTNDIDKLCGVLIENRQFINERWNTSKYRYHGKSGSNTST